MSVHGLETTPLRSLDRPCFLEAHFYSGGLQVRPLGSTRTRPQWAPQEPDRLVGFRGEFRLTQDDLAVELARFKLDAGRATWVGVYRKSVDHRFGDRGNHAGLGVWLLEHDIARASHIIDGLTKLLKLLEDGGVDEIAVDADTFVSKFLPDYIRPIPNLPQTLLGWSFSSSQYAETALFAVDAKDASAWHIVGEHITRWTVLPPDDHPGVSRGMILVSASAASAPGVTRLAMPSIADVVEHVATAFEGVARENSMFAEQAAGADKLAIDLKHERASNAKLREDLSLLEQQNSGNQTLSQFVAIRGRLDSLGYQLDRIESDVGKVGRQARGATSQSSGYGGDYGRQTSAAPRPEYYPQTGHNRRSDDQPADSWDWITRHPWTSLGWLSLIVVVIVVVIWLIRWLVSGDPSPLPSGF